MSDTDWDALGQDLTTLLGSTKEGGELWQAWEHAKDVDHDEFHDVTWQVSNDDEMWEYYNNAVETAESAYASFHSTWMSNFYNDRHYIPATKYRAEKWYDEVSKPLRNEDHVMSQSRVAESWYGPSAQKYQAALQTQIAAIGEFNQIAHSLATELNNTQMVLKGLLLAIKDSCVPVKDKLNSCEKRSWASNQAHVTFFENVAYGETQFVNLRDWLDDLVSSGDWIDTMDSVKINLEDKLVLTTSFVDGWPKSTTGNMQDMENGNQAPGPGQPGGPGSGAPPTSPSLPPVDTDSDGTGGPEGAGEETYGGGVNPYSGEEHDDIDPNEEG